ncbi:VOC family protein [Xenorhabdus budapestensis]|uniref:VOC family protein n=1 Tax=Xenorhabdus budapestensis TaxID=290110 RepID=A0ABX7VI08_XENBU|nr:VOC family protein [Xenorhabdus budapestensis]QTL40386.1 VOC family protein [Xenorhabdus budapestensis]
MIDVIDFGHINIVVDDVDEATSYYHKLFGFELVQFFPRFRNVGFAKGAGFLKEPNDVDVSINFLKIPNTIIYIELISYNFPKNNTPPNRFQPNELGGPRHIALRVKNIEDAYSKVISSPDVFPLITDPCYKPAQLSLVEPSDFVFADEEMESNTELKLKAAMVSSGISFVYFSDKYGVTWELEEAPSDVDDPALSI